MTWKDKFCEQPWTIAEIYAGGGVYVCCPAWNRGQHIGNIFSDSPANIWNSDVAKRFRSSILSGSFAMCDKQKCPLIIGNILPERSDVLHGRHGERLQSILKDGVIDLADIGPRVVKIGYDPSCNLTCPSCRNELMMAKQKDRDKFDRILNEFLIPFLKDCQVLTMSSDGDPFASKHYRDVMRVAGAAYPSLRFCLCTNGVLFDQQAWDDLNLERRVVGVQISVDAAEEETYRWVRRGGDFKRLSRNLEWLAGLRRQKRVGPIDLLFVTQACNYKEMPAFVRWGKALGMDTVQFMVIDHWERGLSSTDYVGAKVWDAAHPQYKDFAAMLQDPIFDDPIVRLGNVQAIREGWKPSDLRVSFIKEVSPELPI